MTVRIALIQGGPSALRLPEGAIELAAIGPARLFGDRSTSFCATGPAVLIGKAFYREGLAACETLVPADVERIVATGGEWAIKNLWGNFLIFWTDGRSEVLVLRSPVTGPALFQTVGAPMSGADGAIGTAHCAFTDLALARALGFALDRPNPQAIDSQLRYPLLRGPRAEIEDVREILPGEIAHLGRVGRQAGSWLPWDHALSPPRRIDPGELGEMVRGVTRAWSGRFRTIQLELSGGIDSSIVAACLAGRSAPWRGVTMVTAEPDGDERVYANAVAERAGVPLSEILLAAEPADPLLAPARLRVRPGGFGLLAASDAAFEASARDYGADAIFSGTGGDGIFGYQISAAPALDALRYAGPRAAVLAARDLARITGDTIWNALGFAVRGYVRGFQLWPVDDRLLSQRFAGDRPWHPWLVDAKRIAPGQRRYGLGLLTLQTFLDGYDRSFAFPKIAPLLSQPLVEFGLGVQSWQWGEGGVNRALARRAFRDDLPDIVLARRGKGRILSLFLPAFEANRKGLSNHLLDGWMAAAGILDLDAINALLTGRRAAASLDMLRVLQLADIESWARSVVGGRTG